MHSMSFMKGITTGVIIGAAAIMIYDPINDKQRRRLHKRTAGVFRSIGGVIDTALDIKNGLF